MLGVQEVFDTLVVDVVKQIILLPEFLAGLVMDKTGNEPENDLQFLVVFVLISRFEQFAVN